jgi:FMN phosphatase YigB (HAD superfamily)
VETHDVPLASWNDTAARHAITRFVEAVTKADGTDYVRPEERVAVFDNDGTLWCEKPMPIQGDFILRRLAAMAEREPTLRERQPWKAAYEKDYAWIGNVIVRHYQGDNTELKVLMEGISAAFEGMSVEEYEGEVLGFLRGSQNPVLHRPYLSSAYRPMVELLQYLRHNGFSTYIASGGDRDFMRPTARELYGIDRANVIGSSFELGYQENERGGTVLYKAGIEFFDDGPEKPVRIWNRVGRRPILAGGNANGDIEMMQFTGGQTKPALRLLLLHDDADREFDYVAGAEKALERAKSQNWTVVSLKNDWATVF